MRHVHLPARFPVVVGRVVVGRACRLIVPAHAVTAGCPPCSPRGWIALVPDATATSMPAECRPPSAKILTFAPPRRRPRESPQRERWPEPTAVSRPGSLVPHPDQEERGW